MTKPSFRVAPKLPSVEFSDDLQPAYSNVVRISHMPAEIVIDFALKLPGPKPAQGTARILMSPLSAKLFHRALSENLAKYEKVFGEIKIPGEDSLKEYSKLFRPPQQPEDNTDPEEGAKE